ncbi:glycoside hydrolase family 26 protein [Streptomyces sp. NPDC048434]|uniref:glycoside hydrolase family 26 protein n=1 Tax=Streptomyces sp. NPDC048434 TaxID=3365549 RepID=UPI003721232A
MSQRSRRLTGAALGAIAMCLLAAGHFVSATDRIGGTGEGRNPGPPPAADVPLAPVALGAFLGSDAEGVRRLTGLQRWLGGTEVRVGHTYLPGGRWADIEGEPEFLRPWAQWRRAAAGRMFVLNVPMMERNEARLPDAEVRRLLQQAAAGRFDGHFRTLARHLVDAGVPDTVITLGWEMNGITYTHRCAPDPHAWKVYWNRIVTAMRSVPGQAFRFDFAPSRGMDAIGWTACYPGDGVVDIVGMDSYDQPAGETFDEMIHQPYGLQAQADFAAAHTKQISYPEWGLFRNGDNAEFVTRMLAWIAEHRPLYQTITDYCPHGVWQCRKNPRAARAFRAALHSLPAPTPAPTPPDGPPATPVPTPVPAPTPAPAPSPSRPDCVPVGLGERIERPSGVRGAGLRVDTIHQPLGKKE